MPNDGQRIKMIKYLIEAGYKERVFLSHDIHTKHRMVRGKIRFYCLTIRGTESLQKLVYCCF